MKLSTQYLRAAQYLLVLTAVSSFVAITTLFSEESELKYNKLTPEEERVIIHKGTEKSFSGKYEKFWDKGTYTCKRCNAELYKSGDKFDAKCGWPSFDDEIDGAVRRETDADGSRTELLCNNCGAHLGHVFLGEGFTDKNTRHCVNSIALNFAAATQNVTTETAYFAGGCFWGVEYYFDKTDGIISARSGYMGGDKSNPTYREVCDGTTGHTEVVEVLFDRTKTSYEELARLFFEIHDPTQVNRQGPDVGEQYRSELFYTSDSQKQIAVKLIRLLREKGFDVVTGLSRADGFWVAEDYHQDYYDKKGGKPYCHSYVKRF